MKHTVSIQAGFAICLVIVGSFSAGAATPIAEYMFDEPGGVYATNTGSSSVTTPLEMLKNGVWTNSHGPGFFGGGLDQRFVDPDAGINGQAQHTTGQNTTSVDDSNLDSFVSFTLMGWIKGENVFVGNNRRLIDKKNFDTVGFMLDGGPDFNDLRLRVNAGEVDTGADWGDINQWTFFAVTYDGSLGANNVKFYKGTQAGGESNAVLMSTHTLAQGTVGDTTQYLVLGGRGGGDASRSFDGIMDAVRIFGSQSDSSGALSLSEIQFWQSQVPEPSAVLLLAAGGVLLLRRRMK